MRNLPVCKDKCNIPCAWCDLKDKLCNIDRYMKAFETKIPYLPKRTYVKNTTFSKFYCESVIFFGLK